MRFFKTLALAAAIRVLSPCEISAQTQIYNFVTIAGYAGYGSVDGVNSLVRFHFPTSVASDSAGNVYVADTSNSTIRKLAPAGINWVSSTIAGVAGILGSDDGTNDAVQFNYPQGVAVDSGGNVYVADTDNYTVRKLTPVGTNWVSSTIAGLAQNPGNEDGTNSVVRFSNLYGLAVDSDTNIYVADTYNYTLRKLKPVGTNWVSSTIAGLAGFYGKANGTNMAARFNIPHGVAVDAATNVYVADTSNDTIRMITPVGTNWVTSTIGGLAGSIGSTITATNDTMSGSDTLGPDRERAYRIELLP